MKCLLVLAVIFLNACAVVAPMQKSKAISVHHLIKTSKYLEAKGVVEEMINDPYLRRWHRTWYLRGHLAMTAYKEGTSKNDKKLYELYPEQLHVAYESFRRASIQDRSRRTGKRLAPKYIMLANELQKQGDKLFKEKKYEEALKSFENALEISKMPVLKMHPDTNLIYNTAIAAYMSKDWPKAITQLGWLHDNNHSINTSLLLANAHLENGSTGSAKKAILESIAKNSYDESLVLFMTDMLLSSNNTGEALKILDNAIEHNPENPVFFNTKGIIYQKSNDYFSAIGAYADAIRLAPEDQSTQLNIATCYYNIGVAIEENTRNIGNISEVLMIKEKSSEAFTSAQEWLDKVYETGPSTDQIRDRLHELYKLLRISDKAEILENGL